MAGNVSENAPSGYGPGGRLTHAREARGMSLEEAAKALRLSPRHILALERDDYEHLPEPTYVRGYLRSYAQLLGLPADEIIASYNSLSVAHRPADLGKLSPPQQLTSDHRLVRLGSFAVLGLFVGLAALWWYGHEERLPPAPVPLTGMPDGGVATAGGEPAASAADGGQSRAPEATAPSLPAATPPRTAAPAPDRMPAAREAGEGRQAPAAADGPVLEGQPRGRLVLRTLEDCWADVRDAAGNRLLYETIQAGRVVSVEGAAPLAVFLGNVDGVRVEFNGMPYDVARHRRGQVARFTLGEPATARP